MPTRIAHEPAQSRDLFSDRLELHGLLPSEIALFTKILLSLLNVTIWIIKHVSESKMAELLKNSWVLQPLLLECRPNEGEGKWQPVGMIQE